MCAVRCSLLLFLAAALLPGAAWLLRTGASAAPDRPAVDWPSSVDGRPLRQLPLTAVEQRFAQHFPGRIARFSDGTRTWILRAVEQPTRRLHPAADCFKGLGYAVQPTGVHADRQGESWSCFRAEGRGRRLNVCERIHDGRGGRWTDVSSWYWSALFAGQGPWWAVAVVSAE